MNDTQRNDTVSEAFIAPLADGKFQLSASAMEAVANQYGIPFIHMGMEVPKLATFPARITADRPASATGSRKCSPPR